MGSSVNHRPSTIQEERTQKSDITITGNEGEFSAYIAKPESGIGPGLVLIQEIFGVNQLMRNLCDCFAAQGYITACPDLFWRIEPGMQLTDKTEAELNQAFEFMNKFLPEFEKGHADPQATVAHLRGFDDCPAESQSAIAEALSTNDNVTLHNYTGVDHAFARLGGGNYDQESADLANGRTAQFFKPALS